MSGLPVLYRGLEKSVTSNQWKSLGLALVLVVLILSAVFRSPWSGLLATIVATAGSLAWTRIVRLLEI